MAASDIPAGTPDDLIWHVLPINDLREHVDNDAGRCWCNPRLEEPDHGYVVVHNALDGREAFETGERKLS